MSAHGMVVEIKRKTCIVLTADGEYREVLLPGGSIPRLGQEIPLENRKKWPYLKQLMVAASLFIILMGGFLYFGEVPPAAAYLTIDINPSIELAVSAAGKVISARAMDDEGEKILSEVKVKGQDLREAVSLIVAQAVADNYIEESGDNVILATLTVASGDEPLVDLNSVYEAIRSPMESSGLESDVIIEPVEPELRQEAVTSGISTGRYLLLNKSDKKGLQISISDITSMSLGKLEKEKKMNLVDLVAGKDDDRRGNGNKEGQENITRNRGIYFERQKSAGDQGKSAGRVKTSEDRQAGSNAGMKDADGKGAKGNGEGKRESAGNNGRDKDKSGASSYKNGSSYKSGNAAKGGNSDKSGNFGNSDKGGNKRRDR